MSRHLCSTSVLAVFILGGCGSLRDDVGLLASEVLASDDDLDATNPTSRIDALQAQVDELSRSLTESQAVIAALQEELQGSGVGMDGSRLDRWIEDDVVLSVGAGEAYASLESALAWLADKQILAPHRVRIEVAAGTYNLASPLVIDHPDGQRIEIVGLGAAAADTVLSFAPGGSGLVVDGEGLGMLANLRVQGSNPANNAVGVTVDHTRLGVDGVEVTGFAYGLSADFGADVWQVGAPLHTFDNSHWGVRIRDAARYVGDLISEGNDVGLRAHRGGMVYAGTLVVRDNTSGVLATDNAAVVVNDRGATLTDQVGIGLAAIDRSFVSMRGATMSNQVSGEGVTVVNGSQVDLSGATLTSVGNGSNASGARVRGASLLDLTGARLEDVGPIESNGNPVVDATGLGWYMP